MKWFLAVFIPPLYFFSRGNWVAGIINGFFYLLAFPSMFLGGLGVLFWLVCASHAAYQLRQDDAVAQAELTATRAAAKVQEAMAAQQQDATKNYS